MADDGVQVPAEEVKEKKKKKTSKKVSLTESDPNLANGTKSSSRKQSNAEPSPQSDLNIDAVVGGAATAVDAEKPVSPTFRDTLKEIYNEAPKNIHFEEPYIVPVEVKPHDINALRDIDERKLVELKEAFKIFDFNGDGVIDHQDLKSMFRSLGQETPDSQIEGMLNEALSPLDFDAFVVLLGYRTIDLDPEDVLLEALSKWDKEGNGLINEELLRHDLMSFGDKFSEKEVNYALEEAPIAKGTGEGFNCKGPVMINYPEFCKSLSGLRKRTKK